MKLTVNNQLTLLHDILDEQKEENDGNITEYQQIKRLVQSMMANNAIPDDETLFQVLPEIYHYGFQGEFVQCLTEHIHTNKDNIENWLQAIQQAKSIY
ncbi:YtzH-like family protein [Virgibacillus sp. W0181]|uniref:YtzH-like family protein n=1 Tax=Virgibacillus sp. W0181 TaxID=3391581 RepID=UPI003F456452